MKRIPNSEPDHDVIKDKVDQFKEKVRAILDGSQPKESEPKEKADDTAVVKIFEEIKVMYQDLPSRVANRIERPLPTRRFRRLRPDLLSDIARDSVQNSRKRGQSKEGSQRWMNP